MSTGISLQLGVVQCNAWHERVPRSSHFVRRIQVDMLVIDCTLEESIQSYRIQIVRRIGVMDVGVLIIGWVGLAAVDQSRFKQLVRQV